ncbi:hypothetical protein AKJ40_01355 [candidate division MSBL1 archaeon SCGC-AAA259M10]|uniref:BREX system P-loop protein BrxC n=1 Tax=candidate division MSBL1 archaeon SCGC-AAA259M10 TaxID=1698270 RepID=A0A133V1W7_9EURY|nr:hypothetical protein AKJ40_01355 [candidate division MSBL1 archaeon SCGC-AAA259M10]
MKVGKIFKNDISRDIQSVVKVEDRDLKILQQELTEYVMTDELEDHFNKFFEAFYDSYDSETQDIGMWVAGFFGSGKSQMVKTLNYVLENKEIGEIKASERFLQKVETPLLEANIRNAVEKIDTSSLMFDIKSQEDQLHSSKNPITEIVFRQFNDYIGFSKVPWVAWLENNLKDEGNYEKFKKTVRKETDKDWEKARENTLRVRQTIKDALVKMGAFETKEEVSEALEDLENRTLSPSELTEYIHDYLEKSPHDKFVLIMDEVGQYIGEDSQKLLELQEIAENFASQGNGDLWLIVTAQSKLEEIISGVQRKKAEFNKIADRFDIKINLTSSNIDEVVRERILKKTIDGEKNLARLYSGKSGKIKRNFKLDSERMLPEINEDSFVDTYPFLPYQLHIIPDILTNLRGTTGIDSETQQLTGRERTMITLVQGAIKDELVSEETGALVTLDMLFDQIKNDLEGDIVRRIEDVSLKEGDNDLAERILKSLYLIQQLDWVPKSTDNLATIITPEIDEDARFAERVEDHLEKLEGAKYIAEKPGGYRYLTPTEVEIEEEIESINVKSHEIRRAVKRETEQIMDLAKVSYSGTTFDFTLKIDGDEMKGKGEITLEVETPIERSFSDRNLQDFEDESLAKETHLYWVAQKDDSLITKIEGLTRLEKFLNNKQKKSMKGSERELIREKSGEKGDLEEEIREKLKEDFLSGDFIYEGDSTQVKGSKIVDAFKNYAPKIIPEIYTKFKIGNASVRRKDVKKSLESGELPNVCQDLDLVQPDGNINSNAAALQELLNVVRRNGGSNGIEGKKLLEKFDKIPYGWDSRVVQLLTAVALRGNLLKLRYQETEYLDYTDQDLKGIVSNSREFKKCLIQEFEEVDPETLNEARKLIDETFDKRIKENLPKISSYLKERTEELVDLAKNAEDIARASDLPIVKKTKTVRRRFEKLSNIDGKTLIEKWLENKTELKNKKERVEKLHVFVDKDAKIREFKRMSKFASDVLPLIKDKIPEKNELKKLITSEKIIDKWQTLTEDYNEAVEIYLEEYNDLHEQRSKTYQKQYSALEEEETFQELSEENRNSVLADLQKYICNGTLEDLKKNLKCPNCFSSLQDLRTDLELVQTRTKKAREEAVEKLNEQEKKPTVETVELSKFGKSIQSEEDLEEFISELKEELLEKLKEDVRLELR